MGEIGSEESDVGCEGLRCFLSLTVLLVESDQPTQKIVASILKKCGYRVIAVSDGLKAWNKLNEHPDTIDLVLTEVDLVTISGFNLLTMIMEHEICRNIPVIMMSSNESITTVFKCMLKGAADFLIKPIRKNELRILWQHVWRRRQTPIYGENGCKEKNLFRSQIAFFSGKNASSDYSSNFMDDKQDKGNLGDKGSDAESACTKEDSEGENTVDMENVRENLQPKADVRYPLDTSKQNVEVGLEPELRLYNSEIRKSELNQETEGVRTLTTIRDDSPFLHLEGRNVGQDACNVAENCSSEDKYQSSTPQLELSLSRSSPKNPSGEFVPYTLNHSNASPFSWYGSRGTLAPGLRSNICNTDSIECTLFYDSSSEQIPGKKIEKPINVQSKHSNEENVTCRCDQAGVIHHSVPSREMPAYNISTGYGGVLERTFHQTDPETQLYDCNHMYTLNMTNENLNLKESNEQNHSADRTQNTSISLSIGEKRPRFEESCYGITGDYCIIPTVSAMNSKDGYGGIILQHEPSTNREAALNKFRLKRKNRCFEKKVRYESRKKLAEQRPRVKGQFVRQTKGRPSSMETTIYQRQTLAS